MVTGAEWSSRYPVYQIDFQAVASGKRVASTKRKIRWRFGFPSKQALSAGKTGIDCRGEEHDIVIIWSITSGKRQVYMDGTEIHFSTSRAGQFQYSWSAKGNHVMKVIAHAAAPMAPTPGFRQYDLTIDGQSFFIMPKVYELGLKHFVPGSGRIPGPSGYSQGGGYSAGGGGYDNGFGTGGGGYDNGYAPQQSRIPVPHSRDEEDEALQAAIRASLQESQQYLERKQPEDSYSKPAPAPTVTDLLNFDSPAPPAAAQPPMYSGAQSATSFQTMPAQQYGAPPPQSPYAPPNNNPYQNPPTSSSALVVSGAPPQPYGGQDLNQAYHAAPSHPPYAAPSYNSPHATQPAYGAPPAVPSVAYGPPPPAYGAPPPQQSATGNLFGAPPVDPFAPRAPAPGAGDFAGFAQPAVDDPFAPRPPPPPSRDDITRNILGAYGGAPPAAPQQPQQQPGQPGPPPGQPGQQPMALQNEPSSGAPKGPKLTMNGYSTGFVEDQDEEPGKPLSDVEKAMRKLVNVDRIDEPAEHDYKLKLKKEEEAKKGKPGKSRAIAPVAVASGMVGGNATLEQIKTIKPATPKTGEGIMRAPPQLFHPDAVNAGALVVHGQGPPLIQRGFGVGLGAPPPQSFQQGYQGYQQRY